MKFSICNLGCKVNAYESEAVASELEKRGWERVSFDEPSDAVVIFTCAVTNMAAQKSRKMLHRAKRSNPEAVSAVVGCYAQLDDGLLNEAEIIVGTAHKKEIPDYLEQYLKDRQPVRVLDQLEKQEFEALFSDQYENHARAYLKIQDGCNQFCSYCVIPYARGRERSMLPDTAVREAGRIAENYKEIVLTGIHTGRYGREYHVTLAQLMERMLKEVPALERLRISSIEATELTDEMIDLIASEPRIARHLHIPLQSGSDGVLKRMHRPYSTEWYLNKIEEIRRRIPDISISTDLIVGFPGETEEEFEETYRFLKKCRFSFLHVFPYSARQGTPAAEMPCQIDPKIKKERTRKCTALSAELYDAYQSTWTGREADVVLEQEDGDYTTGHTSEYIPVKVKGHLEHGKMVHVHLTNYENHQMYGEESVIGNETE